LVQIKTEHKSATQKHMKNTPYGTYLTKDKSPVSEGRRILCENRKMKMKLMNLPDYNQNLNMTFI